MITKALISSIIATVILTVGAVFFLEDRYFKCADAQQMKNQMEKESVQTFQQFQKSLNDDKMQDLRDKKVIINEQLRQNPTNTYLQIRAEEINREIQRLEDKNR
jgi:hypothetical protein